MKKILIISGLSLFICGSCANVARVAPVEERLVEQSVALNNNISTNEHPTKEEWLEIYITHKIKQCTDSWRQRIAVIVAISPKDRAIVISLTSANGQEEITQSAKNAYVHDAEVIVKAILETYDWAKNYKLVIQYI